MMKVGSKELFEVVRQVVRDEVKKILPEVVAKHLSEQYIRKALAESVVSKPSQRILPKQEYQLPGNIREIIAGTDPDDEVTPEPLDNDSQGIYEPANPLVRKNETVSKLLSRSNPMASVYEGLEPIDTDEQAPSLPIDRVAQATGMDFSKMNAMIESMERGSVSKKSIDVSEDAKMKELERKRKLLEIPVNRPVTR